jgi:glutamine synthetase
MKNLPEYFGSLVFGPTVMRERLPGDTYKSLIKTIDEGKALDLEVANVVANAIEKRLRRDIRGRCRR